MSSKNSGWDFLNKSDGGFIDGDEGDSYRYSDGSGYYHGADGSEGYIYSDGSGYYHGADGSEGYIYSDGSGYYHGADGSDGYKYSDGSGYYHGADGSDGYKYSDGSGYYHSADGYNIHRDSDEAVSYNQVDDSTENDESHLEDHNGNVTSNTDSGAEALGTLLGFGFALFMAHKIKKDQERREEEAQEEQERILRQVAENARKERIRQSRAKRFAFYKRHWRVLLILIVLLTCSGFGYYKYIEIQKTINMSISSSELIGQNYLDVEQSLYNAGFTNIHEIIVHDLSISDVAKEGVVTEIVIRGSKEFLATDRYPFDSRIDITYHVVKNITVPMSSKDAKKEENYLDVEKAFLKAGFVNIKTEAEYDLVTGWITKDLSIKSVSVDGNLKFDKHASYRPDVEVIIIYHTFSKK